MRYVLHYYKEGKLDTHRALSKIQARVGTPRHTARHYILRWAAAAASVLVVIGIGTYLYQRPTTTTLTADATQQVYRLPDGTMVTLAPHATLSYTSDCREVEMTGKAYFAIHHDARHPFTITDNDYIIRDIGTHLQVEESEGITQLTVLEGAASFGSTRSGNTAIALRAGMSATLSQGDSARRRAPRRRAPHAQHLLPRAAHRQRHRQAPHRRLRHQKPQQHHHGHRTDTGREDREGGKQIEAAIRQLLCAKFGTY